MATIVVATNAEYQMLCGETLAVDASDLIRNRTKIPQGNVDTGNLRPHTGPNHSKASLQYQKMHTCN